MNLHWEKSKQTWKDGQLYFCGRSSLKTSESPLKLWTESACHVIYVAVYRPSAFPNTPLFFSCSELDMMILPSFSVSFWTIANFHQQFSYLSKTFHPAKTLQPKTLAKCFHLLLNLAMFRGVISHSNLAPNFPLPPRLTSCSGAVEVTAFYQDCDGRKSRRPLPATVESLDARRVGVRRVAVRFQENPWDVKVRCGETMGEFQGGFKNWCYKKNVVGKFFLGGHQNFSGLVKRACFLILSSFALFENNENAFDT